MIRLRKVYYTIPKFKREPKLITLSVFKSLYYTIPKFKRELKQQDIHKGWVRNYTIPQLKVFLAGNFRGMK